jgi:predicted glutamine amidotransferase
MCQLTFCRFTSPNLTKMFASISIISNTYISNHDGWGIYASGNVFKTEMNAQLTSDIGICINDVYTKPSPIITHVRMASYGAKVCQENSHPFETENFVLAHNLLKKHQKNILMS